MAFSDNGNEWENWNATDAGDTKDDTPEGGGGGKVVDFCTDRIPTTAELFGYMPVEGHFLFGILVLFALLTLFVYIKEVAFIRRHIKHGTRTMWVLACYPVFSWTALLAVMVPRSGVVIDMIANGYLATCLYNFGRLMVRYMGGTSRLWKIFETGRVVTFNTLPVCCCCLCLPRKPFQMSVYNYMRTMVMQVAIIRPILAFVAVVLYADGTFRPGGLSFRNPFTYIGLLNVVSTVTAVYGLMLLRNAFRPELEEHFKISGKIMSVQLALISSVFPNLIIGILVSTNVIKCGPVFPSKARGEAIYHTVIVLLMLPLSLMAQSFFKRASDGESYLDRKLTSLVANGTNVEDGSDDSSNSNNDADWIKSAELKLAIPDKIVTSAPTRAGKTAGKNAKVTAVDAADVIKKSDSADWPLNTGETNI